MEAHVKAALDAGVKLRTYIENAKVPITCRCMSEKKDAMGEKLPAYTCELCVVLREFDQATGWQGGIR